MSELEEFAAFDKLRKEHRLLIRKHNELKSRKLELEAAITTAASASFSAMKHPKPVAVRKDRRKKGEEIAVVTCADWQLGRITPTYDSEVCEERINTYAAKVETITEIQRADHPVREVRVWLLGDLVDGETVFRGQHWEIDSSLIDQLVTNGARILRDFIHRMLNLFETVKVVGVIGNHGRIGRPGDMHPDTNADRLLYLVTQEWFDAAGAEVEWEIPRAYRGDRGWFYVDEIGKYRALLVHGDQFRGGASYAGLPFYSFANKALKWRDLSELGEMPQFNDVWSGHWHRVCRVPVGSINVRVCGSTLDYDPWSIETLAASARPAQVLAFVNPRDGIVTSEYEVLVS